MNLCRDCNFYRNDSVVRLQPICLLTKRVDPVEGHLAWSSCDSERGLGKCGPEGKNFEPKIDMGAKALRALV